MELKIFDVRHGFCAAFVGENHFSLIDCGHEGNYKYRPLEWLHQQGYKNIDTLIISNFDQDHVSDITTVRDYFTVGKLVVNPTINSDQLKAIKLQGGSISKQMDIVLSNIDRNDLKAHSEAEISTPEVQFNFYYIIYPYETDTNNLSLVTFIQYGGTTILYPGDMEKKGWERLLQNPSFVARLRNVQVFIASHHGRINGYCEEVFKYCAPLVFIVSDQEKVYGTQEHDLYSKHATGINFGSTQLPKIRYVLTTRSDGDLTIFSQNNSEFIKFGL